MDNKSEVTLTIPSPEAASTVGIDSRAGQVAVAQFVDEVAFAAASGDLQTVPVSQIKANVAAIRTDGLLATLDRLDAADRAERPELFYQDQ